MQRISLCTAAAPLSAGWMHQRRYYRPALFYCSSAAVAYCTRLYVGDWPEYTLQECGRAGLGRVTDEALPPPPPCGRPCGPEEGRAPEAAGPLPAGSALALGRSASGGHIISQSGRPPAGGGQTTGSGWMRPPPQPRAAARTEAG